MSPKQEAATRTPPLMREDAAGAEARFEFGENWSRYLSTLNDERIAQAEESLKRMLSIETLAGKTFLDVGCGSGLFSLAARRLGAKVRSFDYDRASVACTAELKRRYFAQCEEWAIEQGSVLDREYLGKLGQFDIVYSWGVLHHTGAMWQALENVFPLVRDRGTLYIAIYNTQPFWSPIWVRVKQLFNRLPRFARPLYVLGIVAPQEALLFLISLVQGAPGKVIRRWTQYQSLRGMSWWHDAVDWVGGFPFETARPEEIFEFYRDRGFALQRLCTCGGGLGCNEYVFRREHD